VKTYLYIFGILFCEIILLLNTLHITADAKIIEDPAVHAFMESVENQAPTHPELVETASVIRRSDYLIHELSWLCLFTCSAVIILTIGLAFRLRGMVPRPNS
jgi:hypothetical protein